MLPLREQPCAARALDDAGTKWFRAHDAWEAVTWIISRDPKFGIALSESGAIRTVEFQGARSIDMPTVTLIYEITALEIIVHDAKFEDAAASYAGRA